MSYAKDDIKSRIVVFATEYADRKRIKREFNCQSYVPVFRGDDLVDVKLAISLQLDIRLTDTGNAAAMTPP